MNINKLTINRGLVKGVKFDCSAHDKLALVLKPHEKVAAQHAPATAPRLIDARSLRTSLVQVALKTASQRTEQRLANDWFSCEVVPAARRSARRC